MKIIWYLLKCPEGSESDYAERCRELVSWDGLQEIVCFQYQRMIRYGGNWHLERRMLLPGYIFLSGIGTISWKESDAKSVFLSPSEYPYPREMCQWGNLIGMSGGIIKNGILTVTSGPLKGREKLIRRIDRHKRTAEIEIPFADGKKQVTVGLEIYEKMTKAKDRS